MKLIIAMTLPLLVGCNGINKLLDKEETKSSFVEPITDAPVQIDSFPESVPPDLFGNVGFHKRVFKVVAEPSRVYIKRHRIDWEALPSGDLTGVPQYLYDALTKEVRFQNVPESCAYAIYY